MKNSIIIVDDDELILELYSDFFEQQGFTVYTSNTIDKAINLIKKTKIDIILSDIVMPHKNGFDLFDEIQQASINIPIIFMTGYELDSEQEEKLNSMNSKWISKPSKLSDLISLVYSQLLNN